MVQHDGIITDTETYQIENMKVFWEAFRWREEDAGENNGSDDSSRNDKINLILFFNVIFQLTGGKGAKVSKIELQQ